MNERKETIIERMKVAGYTIINEYDDKAGEYFPMHDHPADQFIVVMQGSIKVNMAGQQYELGVGDELVFPAKVLHDATVGSEGCCYIDGEKPSV